MSADSKDRHEPSARPGRTIQVASARAASELLAVTWVILTWSSPLSWAMEKVRQHAVVASIEISEPGERPGLPLAAGAAGLPVTIVATCFAVRLTVADGEAAGWLAGMDIEP